MRIYQKIGRFAKILLLTTMPIVSRASTQKEIGFDDWIKSGTCSQNANILCGGYYKQPEYISVTPSEAAKLPITISSDEANFVSKGTSMFQGNVVATQGDKFIFADQAEVEHNSISGQLESITALGNVSLKQPGLRIDGTKAVADIPKDRKIIDNAVYRIYERHGRGTAKSLIVDGQSRMQLNPASYTTCAPDSNAWTLYADKTDFDRETGRGQAWNAKMYVKDIPVFYWPYVNFPIDKRRQTGFLQPEFESSSMSGKTLILPFYWNMAPNYDSTIRTNYTSRRGFKFDTEWRYLTRTSNGKLSFDFLPDDRVYKEIRANYYNDPTFMLANDTATKLRRNDLKPRDFRYRIGLKHTTNFDKNWQLDLDYNDASDGNYLYDFSNHTSELVSNQNDPYDQQQYSSIYALQRAALFYNQSWGTIKYQLEQYKTFHVVDGASGLQQLSKLPEIAFNSANFNLLGGFNGLVNANLTRFKPRLITDNDIGLNYGQRLHTRPALMYQINEPGWFVQPRMQLNTVKYSDLHITKNSLASGVTNKSSSMTIPMYDLKTGMIFERSLAFKHMPLLQTIEPQVYYLYVPNKNQEFLPNFDSGVTPFDYNQVFRDNRYTGLDRVSEANQLGLGMTSRLFSDESGEELAMFGIGQIRYMRDKALRLKERANTDKHWSPLAMIAKWQIYNEYSLEANWVRDRHFTNTASMQAQYRRSPTKVINFGYEYVRNSEPDDLTGKLQSDIKQFTVSSAWQITNPVRLLAKASYDLRFHRELNMLAGFEYHTCCTALRFIWTKDWQAKINSTREYAHRFRLQFIFKGFAGVGNAEYSYINAAIPGYAAQDK